MTSSFSARSFSTSQTLRQDEQIRMLILGSPGAGKGTQSGRLTKKYGFQAVVGGDVLREHVRLGTDIGLKAQKVMESGSLMPDEIMMELMTTKILDLGDANFLLDGFPRTLGQAKMLDEALVVAKKPLTLVANLDVPEEVILGRVLDRWVHLPSGRTYNLSYNPPKEAGKDDVTGEPLSKRPDDNIETFTSRLKSYHAQTEPLREYFAQRSGQDGLIFVNLEGRTSDEIWPKLEKALQSRYPSLSPLSG
ncbi:hypothetical protein OC846_000656 [Tilletia horrida]|uniref:GTP:AMP phosphotransferase, mitochondrial n=1 Tax=Tilletia horrida TaxID=155126 RepID=A0AAN6JWT7_9BASI|nr:hypothetical protein OC846_000656 [Tilletia horrida]